MIFVRAFPFRRRKQTNGKQNKWGGGGAILGFEIYFVQLAIVILNWRETIEKNSGLQS